MSTNKSTILGISPGTRTIGMAIYKGKELADYKVKAFCASWSENKYSRILETIQEAITSNEITCIAMKIQRGYKSSSGLMKVVEGIMELAVRFGIQVKTYLIEDLHKYCSFNSAPCQNKSILASYILCKYPELIREYRKCCSTGALYYIKIFEAVACIHVTVGIMDESN